MSGKILRLRSGILVLPAGPLLDSLVSEEVFGVKAHYEYSPDGPIYIIASTLGSGRVQIYPFSTSIASAWKVVEHLKKEGYTITMNTASKSSGGVREGVAEIGDWHCNVVDPAGNHNRFYSKTLEHALCICALLAVNRL
jgi:hypothetical protein